MSRLPQLQRALVAAAERVEAAPARTTLRRRRVRTLAIALAVALGLAGVAYAATQLIETGEPVPPPPHSGSLLDRIVPGTTRVLPVRAADPDGGPPWGLRVFRAKSGAFCVQTGRVVNGKLGVLGQDGAFHNDGRFHELPVVAEGCGGRPGVNFPAIDGAANAQTASAYSYRVACETRHDRYLRRVVTPRSIRAALRLQLRRGERAAARVERRVLARFEREAARHIPLCPTRDLRDVIYGFLGPEGQRVELTDPTRPALRVVLPVSAATAGAYLHVLRGSPRDYPRLQRRYFYPGGLVCGRGFGVHPDRGCARPPGFPPTPAKRRVRIPPALHVPIQALRGYAIRYVSPFANRRYQVFVQCNRHLTVDAGQTRPLPAGRPSTVRLHIDPTLAAHCQRPLPGQVRDRGRRVGRFVLHPRQ